MGQWTTKGLQWALECLFTKDQTVPDSLYLLMCEDISIAKDAELGDLSEIVGGGYSRQEIPSTSDSGDGWISALYAVTNWAVTGAAQTFNATGTWPTARTWALATTVDDTGVLLCWDALEEIVTLEAGESVDVTPIIPAAG